MGPKKSGPPIDASPMTRQEFDQLSFTDFSTLSHLCEGGDVALVNAQHVLDCIGPIGCRQQLPDHAFHHGVLSESRVIIIAISCPWLSARHPDPHALHLARIQKLLAFFLRLKDLEPELKGKSVVIYWDWVSVYQAGGKSVDSRSPDQMESFRRATRSCNYWFAHHATHVWLLTGAAPVPYE